MNLLLVAVVLWVVGFILNLIGTWIRPRLTGELPPGLWPIIIEALQAMIRQARKALDGPSLGDRLQGFGSLLFYAGLVVFIIWVLQGAKTT